MYLCVAVVLCDRICRGTMKSLPGHFIYTRNVLKLGRRHGQGGVEPEGLEYRLSYQWYITETDKEQTRLPALR